MPADSPSPVLVPGASSESQKSLKTPNKEKQHEDISDHLPYELGYLPEDIRQMAEKELGETEERKQAALRKFRQLIAGMWDPEKVDRDLLMWVITHCMIQPSNTRTSK
ncbi:hypothetical protein HNY73_014809 [Argiope bruennichi]|uniref:Uncharacterized protein n=1 Tax=Argiope bruennichi TaxID=94029 RepID=A0A8T0EVI6_ARGBR|nr:hypothetical protein HNY73_014809 [Argiope bruennichi]